jgi:hypothetical protein
MMIDRQHSLPLAKQAKALGISRGTLCYVSRPVPAADLAFQRRELPAEGQTTRRRHGQKAREMEDNTLGCS